MKNALLHVAVAFLVVALVRNLEAKVVVSVSILPQKQFVQEVGGDRVEVNVMVPPGANPHSYEPKPIQLRSFSATGLYVKIGTPIEFEIAWMDKLKKLNPNMAMADMSKGVSLIRESDDISSVEPHIWMSPKNVLIGVKNICEALISLDPAGKDSYSANLNAYSAKLRDADLYISKAFSKAGSRRRFMVFHPSFAYFAKDYSLEEIPIEREGKEPTAMDLKRLVDEAKKDGIKEVFVYPETSDKSAKTVAGEIGASMVVLDPLSENYIVNIKSIADKIAQALR